MTDDTNGQPTTGGPATPGPHEEPTRPKEDILPALDGEVEPVRKPFIYFAGLFVVAVAMVILPLIYVALIAAVAYGVYYHATEDFSIVSRAGNIRVILLSYLGPLVVGVTVIFFMIKPLFARPPKRPPAFSVDPDKQPLLFEYVAKLSALVRAPLPKCIDLDCNVNASAGFRRGLISMLSNDLVLTIGLPLVEGMTLRQLTGVLAHELGHFSQGGGMRLSYVIRSVNLWFARVVYERDAFDESLEGASRSREGGLMVMLVVNVARGCVWLTRRILWVLMTVGHFISCFLLRQMEYDADRYEARVSGSAEFGETAFRLTMLTVGGQIASDDLGRSWEERKLPDRYPELIALNADRIGEETADKIRSDVLGRRTGLLDTHPSDADRIHNVQKEEAPGLMKLEAPARALFDDYPDLSRTVTLVYYAGVLGGVPKPEILIPTAALLEQRDKLGASYAALGRFFQGFVTSQQPVFPSVDRIAPAADGDALLDGVKKAREQIRRRPGTEGPPETDVLRGRLESSLQLLRSPLVAVKLADEGSGWSADDIDQKVKFLHAIRPHYSKLLSFGEKFEELVEELQYVDQRGNDEMFVRRVKGLASECRSYLETLKADLHNIRYPYEHAVKDCMCDTFAIAGVPPKENIGDIVNASGRCIDCMIRLYMRVLADLALAAETAESAAGLEPLPEVPEPREAAEQA